MQSRLVRSRVRWKAPLLSSALLLSMACSQQASRTSSGVRPAVSQTAGPASAPPETQSAAPPASLDPEGCELRLANPPGNLDDQPGPAYLLVHGGFLRIAPSQVSFVELPFVNVTRTVAGPSGEVWFADREAIHVLDPNAIVPRRVGSALAGERPHQIVVDAAGDLWGFWVEGDWAMMKSWEVVRHDEQGAVRRAGTEFTGPNARPWPDSIAATSEGLWVSTSNGLWRAAKGDWQKVEAEAPRSLATAGGRLVGVLGNGLDMRIVVREEGQWRSLSWRTSKPGDEIWIHAASPSGLIVAGDHRGEVWLGSVDGTCSPIALGAALQGRRLMGVAIDGRSRVWVTTGYGGMVVFDRAGRVLADYLPWSLPGFAGAALAVAVPSAGPEQLPPAKERRRVDVVGQLFAGPRALEGATVRINVARLMERETVTDDSGSFRLSDVPEGSYTVEVVPQPRTPGCNFNFTLSDFELTTVSDCPPEAVGSVCDLGKLRPCRDGGELR